MDPWEVLGVPRNASKADIKAAFKRVAMQCHPDKLASATKHEQQHAEARFRAVKDAYELLTDHRAVPRASHSSTSHHGHSTARQQYEYAEYMRYQARARRRYAQTEAAAGVLHCHVVLVSQPRSANTLLPSPHTAWARRFVGNFTRIDAAFHVAIFGGSLLALSLFSGIGDGLWARHNTGKSFEEALATVQAAQAARRRGEHTVEEEGASAEKEPGSVPGQTP